jgi:hypothetical protein
VAHLARPTGAETFPRLADDLDCEQTPHEMPLDRELLALSAVYALYAMQFALDIWRFQFYK